MSNGLSTTLPATGLRDGPAAGVHQRQRRGRRRRERGRGQHDVRGAAGHRGNRADRTAQLLRRLLPDAVRWAAGSPSTCSPRPSARTSTPTSGPGWRGWGPPRTWTSSTAPWRPSTHSPRRKQTRTSTGTRTWTADDRRRRPGRRPAPGRARRRVRDPAGNRGHRRAQRRLAPEPGGPPRPGRRGARPPHRRARVPDPQPGGTPGRGRRG